MWRLTWIREPGGLDQRSQSYLSKTDSPDIALIVDEYIVTSVEIIPKIVVQQCRCLVSRWIKRRYPWSLFNPPNAIIAS
jgi:hypothetical protein